MSNIDEAYDKYRFWPLSSVSNGSSVTTHFLYNNGWVHILDPNEIIRPHRYLTKDEFAEMCKVDQRMADCFHYKSER